MKNFEGNIIKFGLVLAFCVWFFLPQILPNKHTTTMNDVSPAKAMYYRAKAHYSCEYRDMGAAYSSREFCVQLLSKRWENQPDYDPRDDIKTAAFQSTDPVLLKQREDYLNHKGFEIEGWTAKDYEEKHRKPLLNRWGY